MVRLNLSYVDCYLIHNPRGGKVLETCEQFSSDLHNGDDSRSFSLLLVRALTPTAAQRTGDAMLELKAAGKAKSVGVSNFGIEQLQGLKAACV